MPQFVNLLFLSEALWPLPCGSSGYIAKALVANNFGHTVSIGFVGKSPGCKSKKLVETIVLTSALKLALDDQIFIDGNKTIILN